MKRLFNYKNSEEGFAFVFILLAVVLVFSITLVSGSQKFQYSPETPPAPGNPTPTATSSATPPPQGGGGSTPTPGSTGQGSINVTLQGCRTTKEPRMEALATVASTTTGNIVLEIQEGTSYRQLTSLPFSGGTVNYNLLLHNSLGFNASNWRVRLLNNGNQSAIYNGNPTGC